MTTIIRRTAHTGDPSLPRIPFDEPGVQPQRRLSALSFQGGHGDAVTSVPDAMGAGAWIVEPGFNSPVYRILPTGVPAFHFDCDASAPAGQGDPCLVINPAGSALRSVVIVGRVLTQPINGSSGPTANGQLLYGGGSVGVSIRRLALGTPAVQAYGGSGSTEVSSVPVALSGPIQFIAVVFNGASSIISIDGSNTAANTGSPGVSAWHRVGGSKTANFQFQVVEASTYATALSPADLIEKRAHARAVYQF